MAGFDPSTAAVIKISLMVASLATTIAIAASSKTSSSSTGPRLGDLSVSAATYGLPIPRGWGVVRTGGNMIWTTGIKEAQQTQTQGGGKGGLGGKSSASITTFTYSASFAFAFAQGPADRILRIWADSKVVYDQTGAGNVSVPGVVIRQYLGDENQLPDPLISSVQGDGQVPAYRGLVYIVAENVPLEGFGNRIPNVSAEIAFKGEGHSAFVPSTNPIPFDDRPAQFHVSNLPPGHPNVLPLDPYQETIDYTRGVIYSGITYVHTTDSRGGIAITDLDSMEVVRMVPVVDLYSETGFGSPPGFPHDFFAPTANCSVICGDSTDLFVVMNLGSRGYFTRVNPESMKITGEYGSNIDGGSSATTADAVCNCGAGLAAALNYAVSVSGEIKPLVAYSNNFIGVAPQIFDGKSMTHVWGSQYASIGGPPMPSFITPRMTDHVGSMIIPGRFGFSDGTCEFFWFQSGFFDGDPFIDVWRIRMPTAADFELAFTIPISPFSGPDATALEVVRAEYDRANDAIIIFFGYNNDVVHDIISVTRSGGVNWHTSDVELWPGDLGAANQGQSRLLGSTLGICGVLNLYVIDTTTGAYSIEARSPDAGPESYFASYNSTNMTIYGDVTSSFGGTGGVFYGALGKLIVGRGSGLPDQLSTIVADLCVEAGLPFEEVDVSQLTDQVSGYSRVQETARNLLADLCQVYTFDIVESDYIIVAKKRGSAPVATIPYANLLPSGTANAALPVQRNQAEALPRRFWVRYSDIGHDQQQGTAHFQRAEAPANASVSNSAGEITLDLRLVLNADQAKSIAKTRLMLLWGERELFPQINLPPAYLALDPGDVVILQGRDGTGWRVRLDKVAIGADLSMQCEGAIEDPNLLSIAVTGFGGTAVTPTLIPSPYTPTTVQPEMPLLRDGDDLGGTGLREYGAIGAYRNQTFGGASVYISPDNASWTPMFSSTTAMAWGTTLNALPPPPTLYSTDSTNFIDVNMTSGGTLMESATPTQVLEGVNPAILITAAGEVELLQYTTVTQRSLNVYRLTGLLRGRKGSEWVCDRHLASERFVVVDPAAWRIASVPTAFFNTTRYEKTLGLGDTFDGVMPVPRLFKGTAEMPYAPVWIGSTRDVVSNDLTITWEHRTRIGGEWIDGTEAINLGEAVEAYDIVILASDGTAIRTLHASTPSVVYTNTDQTTDGMAASPIAVAVYQVSSIVGRGYPAYANLPANDGTIGTPDVTLTGLTLSDNSTYAGIAPPLIVGALTVSTTGGPFTGAFSLAGPHASKFAIAGSILRTATLLAVGDYYVTVTAAQAGAIGSPIAIPAIITAVNSAISISNITLSNTTFISGIADLIVGTIAVIMPPGSSFAGTVSLAGTDASAFVIVGDLLQTASALAPRSYFVSIVATQTGVSNSPFTKNFSLSATTTLTTITLANAIVASSAPTGTVVGAIVVHATGSFIGTLALSGTDAAKFSIVSNNLVTATSLAAGFFSVSIKATQSGATGSPMTRGFTIQATAGGSVIAPSQAVSAGYTTLVWDDDFTDATTIASTQNATTGFKWYWAQRSGAPASPSEWSVQTTATAASISNGNTSGGSNASTAGGILSINTGLFPNANLITLPGWAMNAGLTSMPPLGLGRWQHMYFEIYVQFQPDQNSSAVYTSNGWPSIWFWASEGINDYGFPSAGYSTANTTELDLLESFGNTTWVGGGSGPANSNVSTIINWQTNTDTAYATVTPLDGEWHTVGLLWTPGHVSTYFDNSLVGSQTLAPNFTALDSQSLFLIIGTGPSWVMNIDWVRVWQ